MTASIFASTLPTLTVSTAGSGFRMRKLPETQVSSKITMDQFKRKTNIVSVASDAFELAWNTSKRGRGDKKHLKRGRRFKIQAIKLHHNTRTIRTQTHPHLSIHFGRCEIATATHTNTESIPHICMGKQGRRNQASQELTRIIVGRITPTFSS